MEKKIKAIIAKVRELLKDDENLKPLLKEKAKITIFEEKDKLRIFEIEIGYYDNVVITEKETYYLPERGGRKTLYKYKNYEELLKIKNS